jgi:hypothetical protein
MAYEFVEAFSSVVPRVRISKILAALSVFVDLVWRIATCNFLQPSFIDIPAALLNGFYLGRRPPAPKSDQAKKSKWMRLS